MDNAKETVIQSLTLSVKKEEGKTVLHWQGESDEKNPTQYLVPFFDEFLKSVDGDLDVIFNNLNYMNSSTIHPLIMFIKSCNDKNIKTTIYYDKTSAWQEASFKALHSLTQILTNIRVIGT